MSYELRKHQRQFANFWAQHGKVFNFSGCGTGKTLSCIDTIKQNWPGERVLVLAPLSILETAWGGDLDKFWPETTYTVAYAKNREKAFQSDSQWVITNHDAVKVILENGWHTKFDVLIIDEGDAFRNRTSARSKALNSIANFFDKVTLMTGTPMPKTVLDVWNLAFVVDKGERLGRNFFAFRGQVCTPKPIPGVPNAMNWQDKDNAKDIVGSMLADITYRVELDDVEELPETVVRTVEVNLPAKVRRMYESMRKESLLLLESGELVDAIHAGARRQKLLQMMSGAVYSDTGVKDLHPDRTKLVMDMAQETDHAIVAFNWRHQKEALVKEAKARKMAFAVIDGTVSASKRPQIVRDYQAGLYDVIIVHPQSAGHGITLTRANRIIWASPPDRADLYEQLNHRVKRIGQKRRTEIIQIAARETVEEQVYEQMLGKKGRQDDLLLLFSTMAKAA